ncbi:MAG: trypsin-like peptidase domain-containing protein [Nitrospinae bacterium]|nr:trypsin-like peptidase domain-containing protein [Nitrospinota bacterium]
MKKALALFVAVALLAACRPDVKFSSAPPRSAPNGRLNANFVRVAREATPAVVYIYTLKREPKPPFTSLIATLGLWQAIGYWLHSQFVSTYKAAGAGSGFIINKRGYILTNYHVVADADRILVRLSHGQDIEEEAERLGADPMSDVALIKIPADYRHHALKMGDSDALEVGEWVAAIGNPYDVGKTFTAGVVSGLKRDDIGMLELEDFIQTDAAINPGNSGGPLIDIRGNVVGINSALYSESSRFGLAVPINIAKEILPKLVNGERIERGMLGVLLEDLTPETARRLGVTEDTGVLVISVRDGSPAAKSGIRPGDVITAFNGLSVRHYSELKKQIVSSPAGTRVRIDIIRGGKPLSVETKLAVLERKT